MGILSGDGAPGDRDERRRAEVLAEQIEEEIIELGWPVGDVIGLESGLLEKYGVSRAVFREAARIIEHHGVAGMRRGPGGGLVVRAPELDAIVRTVALNLRYLAIEPHHVVDARIELELESVRLAAERLTPEGAQRLRDFLAEEVRLLREARERGDTGRDSPTHAFHILVAELTANPAMQLFVETLGRLTGEHSRWPVEDRDGGVEEVHRAHVRIADALVEGDVATAQRRMRRHLEAVTPYLSPGTAKGEGAG